MGASRAFDHDTEALARPETPRRDSPQQGRASLQQGRASPQQGPAARFGHWQGTVGNAAVAAALTGGTLVRGPGSVAGERGERGERTGAPNVRAAARGASEATVDGGPQRPGPDPKMPAELRNRLAQDAFYEQLTHNHAYENSGELSPEGKALLASHGYRAADSKVVQGAKGSGFQMRYYLGPTGGESIIAFRGTEASFTSPKKLSEFFRDVGADADPGGIGLRQYLQSAGEIEQVLRMAQRRTPGRVVVTGQSLGGALAQICVAMNPELVNKVVTFQAPGINKNLVERYKDHATRGGTAPEVTHHKTKRDFVHTAGEAELPGRNWWASAMPAGKDTTRWGVGAHTAYTVTPMARQEEVLPPDWVSEKDDADDDARYEGTQGPGQYQRPRLSEATRKAVGTSAGVKAHGAPEFIRRQQELRNMEKGWLAAKDAMDREPGPRGEDAAERALQEAGLDDRMRRHMLDQLRAARNGRHGHDWIDPHGPAETDGHGASGSW